MRIFLLSWIGLVLLLGACTSDKPVNETEEATEQSPATQELAGYPYLEIIENADEDCKHEIPERMQKDYVMVISNSL